MPVQLHHRYAFAPATAATADGSPIDLAAANTQALSRVTPASRVLVVPGFTPVSTKVPVQLHPTTIDRLKHAVTLLRGGLADSLLVSGGNVHPEATPFNEGWEMRRHLVEKLGVRYDELVLEPYARHSTTNLRNAGRILLSRGVLSAVVVTDPGQGFYFGAQVLSTFALRSRQQLGYSLGRLQPLQVDFTRVRYWPSSRVWTLGTDPADP